MVDYKALYHFNQLLCICSCKGFDYTEKGYQPGGATVYIKKKNDGSYDVIVINKDNELITAVGGNESRQKLPNRAAVMKMLKNHGGFSGIPVD